MSIRRYTNYMFEAVCIFVNKHPNCMAREVGEDQYFEFHQRSPSNQVSATRLSGRMRDWARDILRILEKGGHVQVSRQGRVLRYRMVEEEEDQNL
jgi:hypothetical protein